MLFNFQRSKGWKGYIIMSSIFVNGDHCACVLNRKLCPKRFGQLLTPQWAWSYSYCNVRKYLRSSTYLLTVRVKGVDRQVRKVNFSLFLKRFGLLMNLKILWTVWTKFILIKLFSQDEDKDYLNDNEWKVK